MGTRLEGDLCIKNQENNTLTPRSVQGMIYEDVLGGVSGSQEAQVCT